MNILALDPSILHLGWAYMHRRCNEAETCEVKGSHGKISIIVSGTIIVPDEYKDELLEKRIEYCLDQLTALEAWDANHVVIEKPEQWGAYKSLASSKSDSLLKLNLLVGALVGWAFGLGFDPVLIKVTTWKGQLPKHVTKKRMEKKYNMVCKTNDEADAIGLGDWYLTKEVANGSITKRNE